MEIVVDSGDGALTYEIEASKAGRRIEVSTSRGVIEVTEVTRNGTPVRTGRFMAARVIALWSTPRRPSRTGSPAGEGELGRGNSRRERRDASRRPQA